ncbi:interleukin-11 receptor subunit alpha isoform X2 [Pungitius pungitius]|uniref:interleukin-11 receptor subunit alpha isoform X2 n=1 Tax=Pungitius pungitius TaxID=134920 RepID=UPI0018873927|nr:interleukin-11 receptor subunit alpha isoform X2 [Pungitius pungitius]
MPGLLSSPVFLTVIWLLSLRLGRAQIQTDEVSAVQYGHMQSNVTLACGKSQVRMPVTWRLDHGAVLPWHQVTSDGTLLLLHADHSAQGNYSCHDSRGLLLHSVRLRLGYPPGKLNVSCRVPNHTHVRCSWTEQVRTFLPAEYTASFRGRHDLQPCVLNVARKHCDVNNLSFWQTMHTLNLTETNALGSETTLHSVKLINQLQPNPPESLVVEPLEGHPRRLLVSWDYPVSWPLDDAFLLIFHIRYRPQGSVYWSEVFTSDSHVVITDALAGHLHQVQIQARDEFNSDTKWSEWSPLLLVRPWEVSSTTEPPEETFTDYLFPFGTKPETSTAKSHNSVHPEDEGSLGLVILLVMLTVVILTIILSLIFVVWVRQRRHDHVTKQELNSMVKMKSVPI